MPHTTSVHTASGRHKGLGSRLEASLSAPTPVEAWGISPDKTAVATWQSGRGSSSGEKNDLDGSRLEGQAACRLHLSLDSQISSPVASRGLCDCSTSAAICKTGINITSLIDAAHYKVLRYYVDEGPVIQKCRRA